MEALPGKVAVVTGAASGIGLALAERFGAAGMKVVMADIERPVLAREAERLAAAGVDVLAMPTDTSIAAEVDALAAATVERFGTAHVVCNNAGVGSRGLTIAELPLADFEWVIAVNLLGVVHGLKAFLPLLLAQDEGHVVNTASVSGLFHRPRMGPYNATKAAVVALSETLAFELAAEGSHVGVSVLCPNWTRTNISTAVRNRPERFAYELTTEQAAQMAEYKARRRTQLGGDDAKEPADVADLVVEAVTANRFYVLTHPSSAETFAERAGRIVAGENPVAPPER